MMNNLNINKITKHHSAIDFFDNHYNESLEVQSQYNFMSGFPDKTLGGIYQEFQVCLDNNLIFHNSETRLFQNYLILHQQQDDQIINKVLNVEFAYMQIIKDNDNKKIGFSIRKGGHEYRFITLTGQYLISEWVSGLDKYVIRMDNLKKFCVIEQIGQGGQAKVYKIVRGNQQEKYNNDDFLAIKVIRKSNLQDDTQKQQLFNEIKNHRLVSESPYVVKLLRVYESEKFINLLMEYCDEGALSERIISYSLTEEEKLMVSYQLLNAIDYFQKKKVIHRDLKPQNIMMKGHGLTIQIKIIDFGFSVSLQSDSNQFDDLCGTPGYMAPEYLKQGICTPKSDLFSIGVILYNMVSGKNLFPGKEAQIVLKKNKMNDSAESIRKLNDQSLNMRALLFGLLEDDYSKRLSADEAISLFFRDLQMYEFNEETISQLINLNNDKINNQVASLNKSPITTLKESENKQQIQMNEQNSPIQQSNEQRASYIPKLRSSLSQIVNENIKKTALQFISLHLDGNKSDNMEEGIVQLVNDELNEHDHFIEIPQINQIRRFRDINIPRMKRIFL